MVRRQRLGETNRGQWSSVLIGAGVLLSVACAAHTPVRTHRQIEVYGVVYAVMNGDTTPVQGAKVWTEPFSDGMQTDSLGRFNISIGLLPQRYTLYAEAGGVRGQTRVQLAIGQSAQAAVVLGAERTPWPPPSNLTRTTKKPPVNAGAVRIVPP